MPPRLSLCAALKEFNDSGMSLWGVKVQRAGYVLIPRDPEKFAQYKANREKYSAPCPDKESEELRRELLALRKKASDAERRASDAEQKVLDANQKAERANQRAADAEQRTAEKLALQEEQLRAECAVKLVLQEEQLRAEFESRLLQSKHDLHAERQLKFLEMQGELKDVKDTVAIQAETIVNLQAEKSVEKQSGRQEQDRQHMLLEDSNAMQCELVYDLRETEQSLREQRLLVKNLKIETNELKSKNLCLENDLKFAKLNCDIETVAKRIEEEAKRVESKKQCNWDHDSHYVGSEVHVVNNQRSERKKGTVKKSYLKREKG